MPTYTHANQYLNLQTVLPKKKHYLASCTDYRMHKLSLYCFAKCQFTRFLLLLLCRVSKILAQIWVLLLWMNEYRIAIILMIINICIFSTFKLIKCLNRRLRDCFAINDLVPGVYLWIANVVWNQPHIYTVLKKYPATLQAWHIPGQGGIKKLW